MPLASPPGWLPPAFSFVIAPNATPENDMVSAIMSAAINNVMRFLISSHLLSYYPKQNRPASPVGGRSRLRHWLCSSLTSAQYINGSERQSRYYVGWNCVAFPKQHTRLVGY
jgi:hypothetical protein